MARAFIGIGSNVGDRRAHLGLARQRLAEMPRTKLIQFSPIYETEPVGPLPQSKYLNAVAEVQTELDPFDLLDALDQVQTESGREPKGGRVKWGPRTLDLDILLYDDRVISNDELIVPHPMMHERWFVLKPLSDLDPNVVHPLLEMTVGELLKYLKKEGSKP